MANEEHLRILKQGPEAWNEWKTNNPMVNPDLSEVDLREIDFGAIHKERVAHGIALAGANLSKSQLAKVSLDGANLIGTNFSEADLSGSSLTHTFMSNTNFSFADLSNGV